MASNSRSSITSSGSDLEIMYNETPGRVDKTFNLRAGVVSALDDDLSSDFANDFSQSSLADSASSTTRHTQDRTHDISVQRCGEELRKQYGLSTALKISLEPSRAKMAPVEMVHVPVVLKQWKFSPDLPMTHEISADNLFCRNNNENWKKLLVGPSGVGKTTEIKMWLQMWCKRNEGPFSPFPVVFYIDGNMLQADTRLGVAISEQCLPANSMTPAEVEDMCRHHARDVLIILDNYNRARRRDARMTTSNIDHLIQMRDFQESNIFVATTCDHVTAMEGILPNYEVIRATGVRDEHVAVYAMKVFQKRPSFGKDVLSYLRDNNLVHDMASSPVLLTSFCQLVKWGEKPSDLGNLKTKSALVDKMMQCIIQQKETTSVSDPHTFAPNAEHHSTAFSLPKPLGTTRGSVPHLYQGAQESQGLSNRDIFTQLGSVAAGRYFSCENQESWQLSRKDFAILDNPKSVIDGGIRLGLLSLSGTEQAYPTNQQAAEGKIITFHVPHFREKLAADHLNRLLAGGEEQMASYNDSLQTVSSLDATLSRKQLMVFAGGHSQEAARRIIRHVADARETPNDVPSRSCHGETAFFLQHDDPRREADELILAINYESQSGGQVNDTLQEVFASPIILVSPTRSTMRALFYMLQHAAAEGRPLLTGVQVDVLNGPKDLMDKFSTLPVSRTDHGDIQVYISQSFLPNQGGEAERSAGELTMKQVTFKTQPKNSANQVTGVQPSQSQKDDAWRTGLAPVTTVAANDAIKEVTGVQPSQSQKDDAWRTGLAPVTTVAANDAIKETAQAKSRASQTLPADGQSADVTGQHTDTNSDRPPRTLPQSIALPPGDVLPTPVSAIHNGEVTGVQPSQSQKDDAWRTGLAPVTTVAANDAIKEEIRVQPSQSQRDDASRIGLALVKTVATNAAIEETAQAKSRASLALPADGESARVTGQKTEIPQISHESYQIIEDKRFIGSGRYGEVYHTTWKGMDVAVKRVKLLEEDTEETIKRELDINGLLNHPNIVKMHAYAIIHRGETSKFGIDLVMEYIPGHTLDDAIFKGKVPHLNTLKGQLENAKALSDAVQYMHDNKCTHSDIKPTNILIRKDNKPFLCDLGLGHIFSRSALSQSTPGTRKTCVQKYQPPEASECGVKVSAEWDVWSLACCLLELFTRKRIWENVTSDLQLVRLRLERDVTPKIIADVKDKTLRETLEKCFSKDPSMRPLAKDLWVAFNSVEDELVSQASSPLTD